MSINDDRPKAGGDGAGDQGQEDGNPLGLEFTEPSAAVNPPDSFLRSLSASERGAILTLFRRLSAADCELFHAAGDLAQFAAKQHRPFGADTLPAAMRLLHGLEVPNDKTRSVLVAAVVCAWPDLRRGVVLRDRTARELIQTGWRPVLATRRRDYKE
jgi:hypothetical protein